MISWHQSRSCPLPMLHKRPCINQSLQTKTGWKQHRWMPSQRPFGLIHLDVSVCAVKVQPNNKISQSDTHSTQKLPWMLSCTQWLPLQELKQPKQGHAHFRKKMGVLLPQGRRCEMNFYLTVLLCSSLCGSPDVTLLVTPLLICSSHLGSFHQAIFLSSNIILFSQS